MLGNVILKDIVSIHKCLNCNNEFALLFSINENGESVNVEPCPVCKADFENIVLSEDDI